MLIVLLTSKCFCKDWNINGGGVMLLIIKTLNIIEFNFDVIESELAIWLDSNFIVTITILAACIDHQTVMIYIFFKLTNDVNDVCNLFLSDKIFNYLWWLI